MLSVSAYVTANVDSRAAADSSYRLTERWPGEIESSCCSCALDELPSAQFGKRAHRKVGIVCAKDAVGGGGGLLSEECVP